MDPRFYHYSRSSPPSEILNPTSPAPLDRVSPRSHASPASSHIPFFQWPLDSPLPPFRLSTPLSISSTIRLPDDEMELAVNERVWSTHLEQMSPLRSSSNAMPESSNVGISPMGTFVKPSFENRASRRSVSITSQIAPLSRSGVIHELPPVAPNRARRTKPQWEIHRSHIHKLYREDRKTLDEVREIMDKDFNFTPSVKMYKQKFKDWGLHKNIPSDTANWMLNKAEKRKRDDNKETTFKLGNLEVDVDRMKRSAKRAKIQRTESLEEARTPIDVTYTTPEHLSPHVSNSYAPRLSSNNDMAMPTRKLLELKNSHVKWSGLTKDEIEDFHQRGHLLENSAKLDEAGEMFREAVEGCKFLLSPTHEYTRRLVYHLACFYHDNKRIGDADVLLDWLTGSIASRVGMVEVLFQHLLKISDLLRQWSRIDEAKYFGISIFDILNRGEDEIVQLDIKLSFPRITSLELLPRRDVSIEASEGYIWSLAYKSSDVNSQSEWPVEAQLSLAWTYVEAGDGGVEQFLQALIQQCETRPNGSNSQLLRARRALVALYERLGQPEKLDEALSGITAALKRLSVTDYMKSEALLKDAIEAFRVYFTLGNQAIASTMLKKIESDAADALGSDSDKMIDLLIDNGVWFQDKKYGWRLARSRFEQALAATLTYQAIQCVCVRIQRLEDALEDGRYEESPGMPCKCFGASSEALSSCHPLMPRSVVGDFRSRTRII